MLCVLGIIARLGFYFTGYESTTAVIIWLAIITTIFMMTNPLVSTMIADTVEYSYYHTGKRCAAITFAGQTFTGKLSVALAGGITGMVLAICGYVPDSVQSQDTLDTLFLFVSAVPIIGEIVRLIVLKFYFFNEAEHAELVEKINRGEFDLAHKL